MENSLKILFAADGSDYSTRAAHYLVTHFDWFRGTPELHLLHVKLPIPKGMAAVQAERLLGENAIDNYYSEEAAASLAPTRAILEAQKVPFQSVYKVGNIAQEIQDYANKNQIDLIVMGSHGHGALANLLLGSVSTKVLAETTVPVMLVR